MNNDPLNQNPITSIKQSFSGLFFGPILLLIATALIYYNERNSVYSAAKLALAQKSVINTSLDKLSAEPDQTLVCFSGKLETKDSTADPEFGIKANALGLSRQVQIYLWNEHQKTTSKNNNSNTETKTYSYEKVWSDYLIKSTDFNDSANHTNPTEMPYHNKTSWCKSAYIGAFSLQPELLDKLYSWTPLPMSTENYAQVPDQIKKRYTSNGTHLLSWASGEPEIGATRISFSILPIQTVTILAQKQGNSLRVWPSKFGDLFLIDAGEKTALELISSAQKSQNFWMWLFRGLGFILLVFGLMMILNPILAITSFIPIFGELVAAIATIGSLLLALVLFLLILAISWMIIWPIYSAGLMALILGLLFLKKRLSSQ